MRKIASLLKRILPLKLYVLLANGCILVPKFYKKIIEELEENRLSIFVPSIEKEILLTRKYAHIIDKGIQCEYPKPGHSRVYYDLLKEQLRILDDANIKQDATIVWAKERLHYYEELQCNSFVIESNKDNSSNVSYEELRELILSRRSNRIFSSKVVEQSKIDKLIEISNWAANSCNKQAIKIFYTNSMDLSKECMKYCKGSTCFSEVIPSFFVFTADRRGYVWPTEMYLPSVDVSLGAQNLFLLAHTLGLSGTILTFAQKDENDEKMLRKLLNIDDDYIIIFCAAMGYAKKITTTPNRKI